ncbi:hypothetical protein [uncultured Psychroserpens sp.]|uniref:hypothetical protein n=1 Tax=uncultured Psychroserpens sp. TaxID=255436 RepID=UPI00262FF07B|nr:hypothetical protein [uncultured Psychroserpens sp.]
MELNEIILTTAGSILFLFALALVVLLIRKDKPYLNAIWLILISFFMMGFSAISNAEVFGLFKYEKEKKLIELKELAEASEYCPDNYEIKTILNKKISEFETTEKAKTAEENAVLGYAHYVVGNDAKAIKYSKEALTKDSTNQKAKATIELANTKKIIEDPVLNKNKENFQIELNRKMKELENNPIIDPKQIDKLREDVNKRRQLIIESGQINQ